MNPSYRAELMPSGCKLISTETARLDGSVSLVELQDGTTAYLKRSVGFGRLELLQERVVLERLSRTSLVPELLTFGDDGQQASILVSVAKGEPLHQSAATLGRDVVLKLIADVLRAVWSLDLVASGPWENAVEYELGWIRSVIAQPAFSQQVFLDHSGGAPPERVLAHLGGALESHRLEVFSHGDLCLPNVIVDHGALTWRLIDLGKAGVGDRFRDLASLKRSLERNIDAAAYADLLDHLEIADDPRKRSEYEMLDWFWYAYG